MNVWNDSQDRKTKPAEKKSEGKVKKVVKKGADKEHVPLNQITPKFAKISLKKSIFSTLSRKTDPLAYHFNKILHHLLETED